MTILSERVYGGEFLLSDANGYFSRDTGTIDSNQSLKSGSVLGKITKGAVTATPTAWAGNTGNGVLGAVTPVAGALGGKWRVLFVEPVANLGTFEVVDPLGRVDGAGKVGAAYAGSLGLTIADGATDFVAGDGFDVLVAYAAGSDRYVAVNPAAHDGSEVVAAISWDEVITGAGETKLAALVTRGPGELIAARLDFGALNDAQIATAKAQLAALHFVIR